MSNIAITIIYDVLRLDEKLIIHEIESSGIKYSLVNLDKLILDLDELNEFNISEKDIVLIRSVSQSRSLIVSYIFENLGFRVINPHHVLELGHNKLFTLLKLSKAKLPIPRTLISFNYESISEVVKYLNLPIVIKPIQGSWGRMVSLIKSPNEIELLVKHRLSMENPIMKILMFQEYINKPNRDIRVIVVNGRAIAGIYRYAPKGEWRTNTARGGIAKPLKITSEIEEISVKACEVVGAYYAGIDLIEDKDGYKILEVNVIPEFKNVMRVTGINIAKEIVNMLIELMRK